MKNSVKVIVLVFLFTALFSAPLLAQEIEDVSEDHWAYESVQKLIDRGYLNLYDDDTFRGKNSISRYEMAVIVSRLLEDLQDSGAQLEEDDVEEIRKLSLEFRDELVEIAQEQEDFSGTLENLKEENIIQSEEIGNLNEQMESLQEELTGIVDSILEMKKMQEEVDNLEANLSETNQKLEDTREELNLKEQDIEELQNQLENTVDSKIENQNSTMNSELKTMENRIDELENKLAEEENSGGDNKTALLVGGTAVLAILLTS
ncbi:MAG: S-layer homology domain-containing protein [Halanaerobiales bacterium]